MSLISLEGSVCPNNLKNVKFSSVVSLNQKSALKCSFSGVSNERVTKAAFSRKPSSLVAALFAADSEASKEDTSHALQFLSISSEEDFDKILSEAQSNNRAVVIEWMAQWCRKCIYLKPKIEKLAQEYPKVQFCIVDVNAVSSALVKRARVSKMPTIQLWFNSKFQGEVIGGHKAWMVIDEIKEMINRPIIDH